MAGWITRGVVAMPFVWDQRLRGGAGLYRDVSTGRVVSPRTLRDVLDDVLAGLEARVRSLTTSMLAGRISLDEWQLRIEEQIKYVHYAAAALDRGGVGRLTLDDIERVALRVMFNVQRLSTFAQAIQSGALADGQIMRRATMYAHAPRNTFHRTVGDSMRAAGFTEARSIRHARDSCTNSASRSGCTEQASLGWQSIDAFVHTGERTCLTSCLCHEEYRNPDTGEIIRLDYEGDDLSA